MPKARHPWAAYSLATIGVVVVLFEIALHAWTALRHTLGIAGDVYELNHWVLLVGVVFGFVGFFMVNPEKTDRGADVLTRSVVAIGGMWRRTGQRTGDLVAVATTTAPVTPTKTDVEAGP